MVGNVPFLMKDVVLLAEFEKLPAIHCRHINVEKDQVGRWMCFRIVAWRFTTGQVVERFLPALYQFNVFDTASFLEDHFCKEVCRFIVIDNENAV